MMVRNRAIVIVSLLSIECSYVKKKIENDMAKLLYMPGPGTNKMKLNFLKFSKGSRKKERKSYRQNLYHP